MKHHKIVTLFSLLGILISNCLWAQKQNPYQLPIINSMYGYEKSILANPDAELVDITQWIENIKIDVRYATDNNFMHKVMYSQPKVFVRKIVAKALQKIQTELNQKGLGLKIFDGYRPYQVTLAFYENAANRDFVANPKFGSKHNRGCAVDLTLINLKTGEELAMGTPYDSFLKASAAHSPNISKTALNNRRLLFDIMARHGLKVLKTEWWHFDYTNWKQYPLMDLSFEELSQQRKKK